jgi:hypothetical protein
MKLVGNLMMRCISKTMHTSLGISADPYAFITAGE